MKRRQDSSKEEDLNLLLIADWLFQGRFLDVRLMIFSSLIRSRYNIYTSDSILSTLMSKKYRMM